MSRKLLVFDIDDTLYLERDYVKSGFDAVDSYLSDMFGIHGFGDIAWCLFEEGKRRTIFDAVLGVMDLTDDIPIAELVDVYRSHLPDIRLTLDSEQFLNELKGQDVDLAVVTDGPAQSQRAKIEALELDHWIDEFVVTAEHGPEWTKPSTKSFLHLQDIFGTCPENCVYFGDNPAKDFMGPQALGWNWNRLRRVGSIHAAVPTPGGGVTIENFTSAYRPEKRFLNEDAVSMVSKSTVVAATVVGNPAWVIK